MTEQTYMKLQDKNLRPVLIREKINRDNKQFKRVVDRYEQWCRQGNDNNPRESYEEDIIGCLFEHNTDGYHLAEFLKEKVYIEPDSNLVDILNDTTFVKESLTNEILGQWVKENFLEISNDMIGKKVNAKQNFRTYENHYITTIKPNTYEVTISDNPIRTGGWVIKFENVTIV